MVAGVDTIFGRLISVSGKTGSFQKTPYVRLSSQIQMRAAFKTIVEALDQDESHISNSIFLLTQKHNALMFRRTTLTKLSEAGVLWHVLVIEGKEWQKVGWDYNWENETSTPI